MKFDVGSMKYEVGANHVGEFMRRYSPLKCETKRILRELHHTKALGDV